MAIILLIDDDEQLRMLFQAVLTGAGHQALFAKDGRQGLLLLEFQEVDLVVVDMLLPDMAGLDVIKFLRLSRPERKIIAMSGGSAEHDYLDATKRLGANHFLEKPFSPQDLLDAVSSQLRGDQSMN